MTYLPDLNVWIALTVGEHVHHDPAKEWLESAADDLIAFCRVTQMGFLRLLTNPSVMKADVITAAQAWHLLDELRSDARVIFAPEPQRLEDTWRTVTRPHRSGANFWTDTYLAAFAGAAGHTLVTFDRGLAARTEPVVLLSGGRA